MQTIQSNYPSSTAAMLLSFADKNQSQHALSQMQTIVIIDPRALITFATQSMLEHMAEGYRVLCFDNIEDARQSGATRQPALVLLYGDQPLGLEVNVNRLREHAPRLPVALLIADPDAHKLSKAIVVGATGILLMNSPMGELTESMNRLLRKAGIRTKSRTEEGAGNTHTPLPKLPTLPRGTVSGVDITPREREILELVVHGNSNKEIARKLDIAVGTVKNHVAKLLQSFHVASRAKLVASLMQGEGN